MDEKGLTTQWINRWMCLLLIILTSEYAEASEDLQKKVTTACYGTIENFLEPNCPDGSKIAVNSVLYGAKAERRQCPMVTNSDNYSPHCCMQEPGDCVFKLHVNTTYHAHCIGQQRCELQAVWSETKSHCNDGPYHSYTNFMVMAYYCIGGAKGNMLTENTTGETSVATSTQKAMTDTTVVTTLKSTTSRPVTASRTTIRSSLKTTQRTRSSSMTTQPTRSSSKTTQPTRSSSKTTQQTQSSSKTTQPTRSSSKTTQQTSTVQYPVISNKTSTNSIQQTEKLSQDSTTIKPIYSSETEKMTIFPGINFPKSSTSDIDDNINLGASSNYTPLQISDQVIGGIIAGGMGMLVTAIGFFLYCRRRYNQNKRPEAHFWQYILTNSLTGKSLFTRYNNMRSSGSSDTSSAEGITSSRAHWIPRTISGRIINQLKDPECDLQSVSET